MAMESPMRLVVHVIEGSNFHQLDKNTSLLLRGNLKGTRIDSEPIPLSSMQGHRVEIGEELIWKMSYKNFQRIKASEVLKLECVNYKKDSTQGNSVGYLIIYLKSITDCTLKSQGWRKLLGSSCSDSQICPQLLMSVTLVDGSIIKKQPEQLLPLDKRVKKIKGMPTELNLKNGISYVGSERFCKERFQLSCTLHSASHMDQWLLDKEAFTTKQCSLQLDVLGQVLHSSKFDMTKTTMTFNQLFVFDILSQTATLKQFLSEHPSIEVSLLQSNKVVCKAKEFLHSIELGVPASVVVFLYGSDMNCEVQPRVSITVVISQLGSGEKCLGAHMIKKEAAVVTPGALPLQDEDTEVEVISDFEADKETFGDVEEYKQPEVPQLELPTRLRATSKSNSAKSRDNHQRVKDDMNETARMTKIVEELEDWKLQQKLLFSSELSAEKERLTTEWEVMLKERQMAMEYEQQKALDMTKNFADQLEREIDKLKCKEEEVHKVKQKYKKHNKQLEERVLEQTTDMKKQAEEHLSKVNMLLFKNKQLQQKVDILEAECTKLKKINMSNQSAEILELKEKVLCYSQRAMELSLAKAEEERAKAVNVQKKAAQQRARIATASAREQAKNNNNENIFLDQERVQLKQEKESLEKLKAELLSVKQTPPHVESVSAQILKEQREALLKSGAYEEHSEVIMSYDKAILKARLEPASGDED